jgi:hypothetical protein
MFDKEHLLYNESHSGKYQLSIVLFLTTHPSDHEEFICELYCYIEVPHNFQWGSLVLYTLNWFCICPILTLVVLIHKICQTCHAVKEFNRKTVQMYAVTVQ